MSLKLAELKRADKRKNLSRQQILGLAEPIVYEDGRTKQCHRDECDIGKIMRRFDITGTISHLTKFEGVYADFSDFDFHEQSSRLAEGRSIFEALPAEIRREFGQSPDNFFAYVNDPKNAKELALKLPALAQPGQQLPRKASPDADLEKAEEDLNKTVDKTGKDNDVTPDVE